MIRTFLLSPSPASRCRARRLFRAALQLRDVTHGQIEIAGEHRVAQLSPFAHGPDLRPRNRRDLGAAVAPECRRVIFSWVALSMSPAFRMSPAVSSRITVTVHLTHQWFCALSPQ
jgi:hypothetical protein